MARSGSNRRRKADSGGKGNSARGGNFAAVGEHLSIYLHYAFDLWVQHWRKQPARGEVIVLRYADNSVVGFEKERTARTFLADLQERLTKFGLSLQVKRG